MCTLSFIPRGDGYLAAMNRDERLARVEALPPSSFRFPETSALYPYEPGGGTWIAVNRHGVTLALLNLGAPLGGKQRSRGEVIPAVITSVALAEAEASLRHLDLDGTLPFRLVGIFGRERRIVQWCWDGWELRREPFPWRRQHWFSSGISDVRARRARKPIFDAAWRHRPADPLAWLRRMHRCHQPAPGAFSICVHRPDAGTRSYTEVLCSRSAIRMRYLSGPPCASTGKRPKIARLTCSR